MPDTTVTETIDRDKLLYVLSEDHYLRIKAITDVQGIDVHDYIYMRIDELLNAMEAGG